MSVDGLLEVEAEGETVGEAKWLGLRKLEKLYPGLPRDLVTFEVVSEGERGLLGVGTTPARVLARFDPATAPSLEPPPELPRERAPAPAGENDRCALVRELLDEISYALGASCRIDVDESEDGIFARLGGSDVAVLIGKRGKTIDSIQYVVAAAIASASDGPPPRVTVDAAGYRDRREARLVEEAARSAQQAIRTGSSVRLEPMSSTERKIVHLYLEDVAGVETHSEGDEPNRYVVVSPAG